MANDILKKGELFFVDLKRLAQRVSNAGHQKQKAEDFEKMEIRTIKHSRQESVHTISIRYINLPEATKSTITAKVNAIFNLQSA